MSRKAEPLREQIAIQPGAVIKQRASSLPPGATYYVTSPPTGVPRTRNASAYQQPPFTTRTKKPYQPPPPDEYIEEEEEDDGYQNPGYTRRSMVVRRQPYTQVQPVTHTEEFPQQQRGAHPLVYIGLSLLIVVLFLTGYLFLPAAYQKWQDDRTYGYPRTYQTDADVGHGGVSHFLVLNVHGTIEVLELPSDPGKVQPHIYIIVRFANQGADLVPASVSFTDMNGNGKPDMEVTVYNGTIPTIYLLFNDGTQFKPHL